MEYYFTIVVCWQQTVSCWTLQISGRFYLWFSLWWRPFDIWMKKKTSSSCLQQTGCLSWGRLSGERQMKAVWKWGAPFQTLPSQTCSFSDQWKRTNWFCPPDTLTLSQTLKSLSAPLLSSSPISEEHPGLSGGSSSSVIRWSNDVRLCRLAMAKLAISRHV